MLNILRVLAFLAAANFSVSLASADPAGMDNSDIVAKVKSYPLQSQYQVVGKRYFGGEVLRVVQLDFLRPEGSPQPELILTNVKAKAIFIVAQHIAVGGDQHDDGYRYVRPLIRFIGDNDERISGHDGQHGLPGTNGIDGANYGERGTPGSAGQNGESVGDAQKLPDLYIISYDVAYPSNRIDADFSYSTVDLTGSRGGNGGNGGNGGRGGIGRDGEVGRLGTEGFFNFFCINPTAGGPGADGSPGGDGGDAGNGGDGSNIFYGGNQESIYRLKTMVLVNNPAPPGKGGWAGAPGAAGQNGKSGEPVLYCPHPFFARLPDTYAGDHFRVSIPGKDGTLFGEPGLPGDDKEIPKSDLF